MYELIPQQKMIAKLSLIQTFFRKLILVTVNGIYMYDREKNHCIRLLKIDNLLF